MSESHSRVLPLSAYRDPNYDSDTSFENYYLNYGEEKNSELVCESINHQVINDDDHHNMEMIKEATRTHDHHQNVTQRVRSSNRRIKHIHRSSMITKPDNSCATDDHDPIVEINDDRAILSSSSSDLFIRRVLQNTDMSEQQHRLSLPCNQVLIDPDRLFTRDELTKLRNKLPIPAILVDPRGKKYGINLKLIKAGATTYCYAIGKPWLRIKNENGFEPDMVLDVRVGRMMGGELYFTLHKVH